MQVASNTTLDVPYDSDVITSDKKLALTWQHFFRKLYDLVSPMGFEKSFLLVNNQAAAADIAGFQLSSSKLNHAIIEYFIQRVTTGGGATELIESGILIAGYKPTSAAWELITIGTPGPNVSGVTLSITADGQVKYTSTSVTGTAWLSKITYRVRTLAAKYAV